MMFYHVLSAAATITLNHVDLMLAHRLRRSYNTKTTEDECMVVGQLHYLSHVFYALNQPHTSVKQYNSNTITIDHIIVI